MRLHLDRERDEPLLWHETVSLDPVALGQELLVAVGPIDCRGRVELVDPEFQVAMDLRYEQSLVCTRCLVAFRAPVESHADLLVVTRPHDRRAEKRPDPELELEKEDLGVIELDGEHLETEPYVAEQVLLDVPMKPLCSEECRGLCPRCGADRNQTPDCCVETVDERWEALGAIRDRLSTKEG